MKSPTVFAQVRRGANPAHKLPDNYRSPEKSGMRLIEKDQTPLVALTGLSFSCRFAPTDKLIGAQNEWREFTCPHIGDLAHTTRVLRVSPQGRETEKREWEHRVLILERDWQRLLAKVQSPNPSIVKPHASEKYFQPCRVQVAHYRIQRYGYGMDDRYAVIVRNMVSRAATESLQKGGAWGSLAGGDETCIPGETFTAKTSAMDAARHAASERQLAFDARLDVVEWTDILLGPAQHCVVCDGETRQRGYEPVVCADCRMLLELGKHARSERITVEIPLEGLVPAACLPTYLREDDGGREDREQVEARLVAELLGLCGVTDPSRGEDTPNLGEPQFRLAPVGRGPSFSSRRDSVKALLTQAQFEHLIGAVETIRLFISAAAAHGHELGGNLLRSLATGRITADEFDEDYVERSRKMQVRTGEK